MAPSSSGLGHEPLTLETGVRFSVGVTKTVIADHMTVSSLGVLVRLPCLKMLIKEPLLLSMAN